MKKGGTMAGAVVLAGLVALAGSERTVERSAPGRAPTAFRIWAAGEVVTDHGAHTFTAASARALMAAQAERGNLYSIDVDHLSFSKEAPPEARKAVGWMRLETRLDESGAAELWAVDVRWTAAVSAGLESDPPEWRYFSPAYRADPKTGEILAYLNTALTNNPATWGVTSLATVATEGATGMTIEELKAALKELADAGDEAAARMLAASEEPEKATEGEGEGEEPEKAETVKAGEGEEPEKEKAPAVAASALGVVQTLVGRIAALEARNAKAERAELIAKRPDFAPEVVAILASADTPLEVVRKAVTSIKRGAIAPAAAAGAEVRAARGASQVDGGADRLPPKEAEELDRRMGLKAAGKQIEDRGGVVVFSAMRASAGGDK
jgi:hypothetical protein